MRHSRAKYITNKHQVLINKNKHKTPLISNMMKGKVRANTQQKKKEITGERKELSHATFCKIWVNATLPNGWDFSKTTFGYSPKCVCVWRNSDKIYQLWQPKISARKFSFCSKTFTSFQQAHKCSQQIKCSKCVKGGTRSRYGHDTSIRRQTKHQLWANQEPQQPKQMKRPLLQQKPRASNLLQQIFIHQISTTHNLKPDSRIIKHSAFFSTWKTPDSFISFKANDFSKHSFNIRCYSWYSNQVESKTSLSIEPQLQQTKKKGNWYARAAATSWKIQSCCSKISI